MEQQECEDVNLVFPETVTLLPTKAGNGFKLVVNGKWYYIENRHFWKMIKYGRTAVFRSIAEQSQ